MKIGDRVYVHGHVDEIRKDTVIVRNEGGYFRTVQSEILVATEADDVVNVVRCQNCKWHNASACFKDDGADNHRDPMDFCSRGERREP